MAVDLTVVTPEGQAFQGEVESVVLIHEQRLAGERELEEVRRSLDGGTTLDEAAEGLDLEVEESGSFGAEGRIAALGTQPDLAAAALALDAGGIGGPVAVGNNLILFEVEERQRFDPAEFESAREQTREGLERQRLNAMLSSLIERRREELGVTLGTTFRENFLQPADAT